MILELASRRPLPNNGGNMIDIKPLSYLDPRLFAPEVNVAPVAQGNLAATEAIMAGINKGIGAVGGALQQDKADKLAATKYSDTKEDVLADRKLKERQLNQTEAYQTGMLNAYKNSPEYLRAVATAKATGEAPQFGGSENALDNSIINQARNFTLNPTNKYGRSLLPLSPR